MTSLFDILAPVLVLIALGYALARGGAITPAGEAGIANVVFFATTPALLFRAMAGTELPGWRDAGVLVAYFVPALAVYAGWVAIATVLRGRGWASAGIGAMGACFGNTVLLGIPIVERAFGAPGLRVLVLIVSIHSAIFFTLTTLLAEADRGRARIRDTVLATARTMARNAIVLAIFGGALWRLTGMPLWAPLDGALALLGGATIPLALIAVGSGLAAFRLGEGAGGLGAITFVKLAGLPALVWLVAAPGLGLDATTVAVATIAAALPVGTNVYVIARRYGVDESAVAGAILVSTLASAATVPVLIALLR
ncbi:MAG: AEC family transporter [Alphaproteobacteria bacterium]|nr:AEC family transporter [Alphaproteobacteria bacterium]